MKSYLKGVWIYFVSHMLFMYIGAVSFAWIDIWFFKKIEASTITATASTITLGLAIYALTKVNEWLKTKKSEKAFERTTLFTDNIFKIIDLNHQCYGALLNITPKIAKEDKFLFGLLANNAKNYSKLLEIITSEITATRSSFHLWVIKTSIEKLLNDFVCCNTNLLNSFSLMILMIEEVETNERIMNDELWDLHRQEMVTNYRDFKELAEKLNGIEYHSMFEIIK